MSSRLISCPVCGGLRFSLLIKAKGNRGVSFIKGEHPVVFCKDCGICFLNPQHEEHDYQEYYRLHDRPVRAHIDERGYRPDSLRDEYDRLRIEFLTGSLSNKEVSIIDIGAGYGRFLKKLSDRGFKNLSGCEPSEEAVRVAEKLFGFRFYNTSVGSPVVPKDTFDVAMLVAVIEHFTDPVVTLLKIGESLKSGGLIYVNTLNLDQVVLRKGLNKYFKFVHTFYFTERSLINCLKKAGFSIEKSRTLPAYRSWINIFHPDNYSYSELNIIARKKNKETSYEEINPENWAEVKIRVWAMILIDTPYYFLFRSFNFLSRLHFFKRSLEILKRFFPKKNLLHTKHLLS